MKERPILFSAAMVRAILDGRKTMTRRVIKDFKIARLSSRHEFATSGPHQLSLKETPGYAYVELESGALVGLPCPYGQPGDRLWVREAWRTVAEADSLPPRSLNAAHRIWREVDAPHQPGFGKYRPPMFMPRWASRITLEITNVKVERVQEISEEDAEAEGWVRRSDVSSDPQVHTDAARDWYADLWDQINAKRGFGWDVNPWVWVVEFRMIK